MAPPMKDFEQLTEWLHEQMKKDQKRLPYEKERLIEELWEED